MRTFRRTLAAIAASLAAATAVRAQENAARPPPQKAVPVKAKPLSPEDAEIVKQLAILEKVDLLRDLELFEDKKQDDRSGDKKPPPGGEP